MSGVFHRAPFLHFIFHVVSLKVVIFIPHLHICARTSPRHLHEHLYASVSLRKNCFHTRRNIHITQIAICPLWLVFEKPLPERAPRMVRRICDWYARHSPPHSRICVNAALHKTWKVSYRVLCKSALIRQFRIKISWKWRKGCKGTFYISPFLWNALK